MSPDEQTSPCSSEHKKSHFLWNKTGLFERTCPSRGVSQVGSTCPSASSNSSLSMLMLQRELKVKLTHDTTTWKCGELKLYFYQSAGGQSLIIYILYILVYKKYIYEVYYIIYIIYIYIILRSSSTNTPKTIGDGRTSKQDPEGGKKKATNKKGRTNKSPGAKQKCTSRARLDPPPAQAPQQRG